MVTVSPSFQHESILIFVVVVLGRVTGRGPSLLNGLLRNTLKLSGGAEKKYKFQSII